MISKIGSFDALPRHKPHTGLEPVALGLKVLCSTN